MQRLDSLSRRSQLGSSPAPGAPGSIPATSGLKFQPKSFIRRSKEEREAQARVEAEKLQARIAANAASSTSSHRGGRGGRGGYQSRGRGGMGRYQAERSGVGQASGVFGGVTRPEDGGRKGRGGMGGSWSGTSRSSNFGSTRVKSEPLVKSERDRDGDVSMGGSGGRRIKTEGGYVSSDEEPDAAAGPRVNIEHINLVSDEDSDEELKSNKGKERAKSVRAPGWNLKPVRLDRHEHLERSVGVSTEASSLTSAELRRKAQEKDEAEGSLFISPEEGETPTVKTEKKTSSVKSKDVEFVRNERKWKGVYQDSDGSDDNALKIKKEPGTEDAMLIDTPPETTTTETATTPPQPTPAIDPPPKPKSPTPSKPPRHRKPLPPAPKPVLQTEEDRAEWARHEHDVQILADELGLSAHLPAPKPPPLPDTDAAITTPAATATEPQLSKDKKDGRVYLFQFPPLVPTLLDPAAKSEDDDDDVVETPVRPAAPADVDTAPVKPDPDDDAPLTDDAKPEPTALDAVLDAATSARGGRLGELVVHADGECVVGWGARTEEKEERNGEERKQGKKKGKGLSMTLGRGGEGELLQEVVVVDVGPGSRGEVWGMGQLVGGFVVVPDWGRILGGR